MGVTTDWSPHALLKMRGGVGLPLISTFHLLWRVVSNWRSRPVPGGMNARARATSKPISTGTWVRRTAGALDEPELEAAEEPWRSAMGPGPESPRRAGTAEADDEDLPALALSRSFLNSSASSCSMR